MPEPADLRHLLPAVALAVAAVASGQSSAATNEAPAAAPCPAVMSTRDAFPDLFAKAVRRSGNYAEFTYNADEFRFESTSPQGKRLLTNLHNAHMDYCKAAEDERTAVLDRYAGLASLEVDDVAAVSKESLLPAVRSRAYYEFAGLLLSIDGIDEGGVRYHLTLGSDIAVGIASDGETQINLLVDETIADLGLDYVQALDIATENLRRVSDDDWIEVGPSLFQSGWNDHYDPARLLLQDVIRRLPIKGDPVALAADNSTLLLTGSGNKAGLLEMAAVGRRVLDETTRPLSGQAIVLVDGEWTDFIPSDADLRPLVELHKKLLNQDYAEQTQLLERLHEKHGDDVFVASQILAEQASSGALSTYATWGEGVVALLPRADNIVFVVESPADTVIVPWNAAVAIVGHLMTETGLYPPRYRIESFPDSADFARLRAHASVPP